MTASLAAGMTAGIGKATSLVGTDAQAHGSL
jgi:hypothetical protein